MRLESSAQNVCFSQGGVTVGIMWAVILAGHVYIGPSLDPSKPYEVWKRDQAYYINTASEVGGECVKILPEPAPFSGISSFNTSAMGLSP